MTRMCWCGDPNWDDDNDDDNDEELDDDLDDDMDDDNDDDLYDDLDDDKEYWCGDPNTHFAVYILSPPSTHLHSTLILYDGKIAKRKKTQYS